MIPATVFLGRYDEPTVAKAISLIELAGKIAALPDGDDTQRWGIVFDWIVENAGGENRSKGADDTIPQRLSAMIKRYPDDQLLQDARRYIARQAAELVQKTHELTELRAKCDAEMLRLKACEHIAHGDEGWESLRNECPSTAAVAELRAQMLSDQGQHIEGTGKLTSALAMAGAFLVAVEGHGYGGMSLYDTAAEAVRAALSVNKSPESLRVPSTCNDSLQVVPAEDARTCETCAHEGTDDFADPCVNCGWVDFPNWTPKPNNTCGDGEKTMGDW